MRKFLLPALLTAVLLIVGMHGSANAGQLIKLGSKNKVPTLAQISNPVPSPGDILLPMPGGLQMVLRTVCIPATGFLDDSRVSLGIGSQGVDSGTDAAWADRQYDASLQAPFEVSDIPASWGAGVMEELKATPTSAATAQNGLRPFLYFIGKYEVSRGQWRAVMEEDAGFEARAGDDQPVGNVSWYEVAEFTRRYSEWLMKNHPDFLPFFAQERRSSFVRLPTEAEWEYAARGGHYVSAAERERTRLHPAPEQASMGDYIIAAVYDSTLAAPVAIGSRKANPLGLHDMLGNHAEMVQTPFQLVSAGHLIGNLGGFVIKGGSWRAVREESLHPGRRVEAAFFVDGAAQRRDDLGFRISLGTILTPKDRQDMLAEEWKRRSAPQVDRGQTKEEDVRVLIREVVREVESPELRQRLEQAEAMASRYNEQVNLNEERMMHEVLLGASFSLETIANYAARGFQVIKLMDAYATLSPTERGNTVEDARVRHLHEIKGFVRGIRGALYYYRTMLASATAMDNTRLLQQLEKLRINFAHDDSFSKNIARRLTVVRKHVEQRHAGQTNRSEWEELQDILPHWLLARVKEYWDNN